MHELLARLGKHSSRLRNLQLKLTCRIQLKSRARIGRCVEFVGLSARWPFTVSILAVTWQVVPFLWLVFDIAQMRAVGPRKHFRMRTFFCVGVSFGVKRHLAYWLTLRAGLLLP